MSSRPPAPQHSLSATYMATVPQNGETLYEWATKDYFEMDRKMWLNANVSIEHTLKVMPCFKNYRIYARVAERECDCCYQINQSRPPGAPKIPCIVSDLDRHDKRCALCIVTKRKKRDCEGDGYANYYPYYYEHQPRRYEPELHRYTSRNVRDKSLQIENEKDLEARKRARLSLGPERIRSTNIVENRSRAATQKLPSQEPEAVRSIKIPEEQSNQTIPRSEVKELLAESERLAKDSSHKKRTETSALPTMQVDEARSTRCGSEVDELLLETICTSPVPINKGKLTDSECTVMTIRSSSSRRQSASSTANTTTTSVHPPTFSENFNELLQPLIGHMTRKDQVIAKLKSQLEEEKSSNENSHDLIKKAAEMEIKFVQLQGEYKMLKEEHDRAIAEVDFLRKNRNRLSTENEELKVKNNSFRKAFKEFSDFMEQRDAGK